MGIAVAEQEEQRGVQRGEYGIEEAPFVYANVVYVSLGPYDVTMDFGYQSPEDRQPQEEGSTPSYRRVVRVAMSHGHAKSLIPLLARLIARLESEAGSIPTPGFEERSKE